MNDGSGLQPPATFVIAEVKRVRIAARMLAEQSFSSRRNPVRMPAFHPEPTPGAGIKRQILVISKG